MPTIHTLEDWGGVPLLVGVHVWVCAWCGGDQMIPGGVYLHVVEWRWASYVGIEVVLYLVWTLLFLLDPIWVYRWGLQLAYLAVCVAYPNVHLLCLHSVDQDAEGFWGGRGKQAYRCQQDT